jgi:glycosyltransferase involved in cell wall biosynthesis
MLWTIGILTIPKRKEQLEKLLWLLEYTIPYRYKHRIEFIVNEDEGELSVGAKRNEILDHAKGKYISFIDDDDLVQSCYLSKIAEKLDKDLYDGIGFWGRYYVSGNLVMEFNHANVNNGHFKKDGKQYRPLNHLNPVRTKIARQIRFPEKNFAEDADYCDRLLASGMIKEEFVFDETMYHYLFDPKKTETQK